MSDAVVVDAHQHFWDLTRNPYPWLQGEPIAFRYGDYTALRRNYLPADYRRGMETLLAEELASEKMRYTLELKDKRVRESELEAKAEQVRREMAAEAAGREQVIAARAQEEAMKHVLPFKQRQI